MKRVICEKNTLANPIGTVIDTKIANLREDYQFIVICACKERRVKMEKQFRALGLDINVEYMNASTPYNSREYFGFDLEDISKQKVMCCCRSHIRAMDYGNDSRYRYSIVVEDDVCFLKNGFIDKVEEIIRNWDKCEMSIPLASRERLLVSIGWVPVENYSFYEEVCDPDSLRLPVDVYPLQVSGTQAYIIRNMPYRLNTDTYKEYIDEVSKISLTKDCSVDELAIADVVLTGYLFRQLIAFPPLVIETDVPSLLGHKQCKYWEKYFVGHEIERDKYLTSP